MSNPHDIALSARLVFGVVFNMGDRQIIKEIRTTELFGVIYLVVAALARVAFWCHNIKNGRRTNFRGGRIYVRTQTLGGRIELLTAQ